MATNQTRNNKWWRALDSLADTLEAILDYYEVPLVFKDCKLGDFPALLSWPQTSRWRSSTAGPAKVVEPWLRTARSRFAWGPMLGAWESNQEEWWYHGYITKDDCWWVIKALFYQFLLSIQLKSEDDTHWHPLTPIGTHWLPFYHSTILPFYHSTYLPIYLSTYLI